MKYYRNSLPGASLSLFLLLFLSLPLHQIAQNVGIGTLNPQDKLHVAGFIRSDSLVGTGMQLLFSNTNGRIIHLAPGVVGQVMTETSGGPAWANINTGWALQGNSATNPALDFVGTFDSLDLVFRTDNSERLRIMADGRVGIAISSPGPGNILTTVSGSDTAIHARTSDGVAYAGTNTGIVGHSGFFLNSNASSFDHSLVSRNNGFGAAVAGTNWGFGHAGVFETISFSNSISTLDVHQHGTGPGIFVFNLGGTGVEVWTVDSLAHGLVVGGNGLFPLFYPGGAGITANGEQVGAISRAHSRSDSSYGLVGISDSAMNFSVIPGSDFGVGGTGSDIGVLGSAVHPSGGIGVYGQSLNPGGWGVLSEGNLNVIGDIWGTGISSLNAFVKPFVIDHPLDPENKYLRHMAVEAPEPATMYRGNLVLDARGEGWVELPDYFSALNKAISYVLTPVGQAAPNLHIKVEVNSHNRFKIVGGVSRQKVSWMVYGERNDPGFMVRPELKDVVIEKSAANRGKYLHPQIYGFGRDRMADPNIEMGHARLGEMGLGGISDSQSQRLGKAVLPKSDTRSGRLNRESNENYEQN